MFECFPIDHGALAAKEPSALHISTDCSAVERANKPSGWCGAVAGSLKLLGIFLDKLARLWMTCIKTVMFINSTNYHGYSARSCWPVNNIQYRVYPAFILHCQMHTAEESSCILSLKHVEPIISYLNGYYSIFAKLPGWTIIKFCMERFNKRCLLTTISSNVSSQTRDA